MSIIFLELSQNLYIRPLTSFLTPWLHLLKPNNFSQWLYLSCLLSSTCMGYGANIISKWETMEEGLQFSNVASQTSDLDSFTMADVMYMMLIDIVIYSLLTWYVVVW